MTTFKSQIISNFSFGIDPLELPTGYFIKSDYNFQSQIWTSGGDVIQASYWSDYQDIIRLRDGLIPLSHFSPRFGVFEMLTKKIWSTVGSQNSLNFSSPWENLNKFWWERRLQSKLPEITGLERTDKTVTIGVLEPKGVLLSFYLY